MLRFFDKVDGSRVLQYENEYDEWVDVPAVKEEHPPEQLTVTYEQLYECLNSNGLHPDDGGGVAIDVLAAWRILKQVVSK